MDLMLLRGQNLNSPTSVMLLVHFLCGIYKVKYDVLCNIYECRTVGYFEEIVDINVL